MTSKAIRWLVLAALCASLAWSQSSNIPLTIGPPPPVANVGAGAINPITSVAPQTLYYWVVARYPSGAAIPAGPGTVTSTPAAYLDGTHYIQVSWAGVNGAVGYDVIRGTSNVYPGTCAACAVVIMTGGLTVNDTGAALAAYPPAGWNNAGGVSANIGLDNQSSLYPYLNVVVGGLQGKMGILSGPYTGGDCIKVNTDGTLASNGAGCAAAIGGVVPVSQGGTGLSSYILGDMLWASAPGTLSTVPANATSVPKFLSQTASGQPVWLPAPVSGLLTFFFVDALTTPNIGTDKEAIASSLYTPAAKATVSTSITGTQTVATWVTNGGFPGVALIPDGTIHLHIHANRTGAGSGTVDVVPQIYVHPASGPDVLIATLEETGTLAATETEYDLAGVLLQPVALLLTDRIMVKFTGIATATRTVVLSYDGVGIINETFSRIELPSPALDTGTYVPYTGATASLNLGLHVLSASRVGTNTVTPQTALDADATIMSRTGALSLIGGTEPTCTVQTDLVVDNTNNLKISSLGHPFVPGDAGSRLQITGGAGWTPGNYWITSVITGGVAFLNSSPAAVGTTGGIYNLNRSLFQTTEGAASTADTFRVCSQAADNTITWRSIGGAGAPNTLSGDFDTISATACTATNLGQLGIVTSGTYNYLRCNGSTWDAYVNGVLVNPPLPVASYTTVNANSTTIVRTQGITRFFNNADSLNQPMMLAANLPGATYTITIRFYYSASAVGGVFQRFFVGLYDGTKVETFATVVNGNSAGIPYYQFETWATVSSSPTTIFNPVNAQLVAVWPPAAMRIVDNGSTRKIYLNWASQPIWVEVFSEATNTFLTPTQYVFGLSPVSLGHLATMYVWDVTATTP